MKNPSGTEGLQKPASSPGHACGWQQGRLLQVLDAGQGLFAKLLGLLRRPLCCASSTQGCQALFPSWEVRALSLDSCLGKRTTRGNGPCPSGAADRAWSGRKMESHRCLLSQPQTQEKGRRSPASQPMAWIRSFRTRRALLSPVSAPRNHRGHAGPHPLAHGRGIGCVPSSPTPAASCGDSPGAPGIHKIPLLVAAVPAGMTGEREECRRWVPGEAGPINSLCNTPCPGPKSMPRAAGSC